MAIYNAQVRTNSLYFFQGVSSCRFSTTCDLYIVMSNNYKLIYTYAVLCKL